MTMTLNCTQCGAPLQPTDAQIRSNIMTCNFCGTVLHLVEDGLEKYQNDLVQRKPPADVTVKRYKDGGISIKAKLTEMGNDTQNRGQVSRSALYIILGATGLAGIVTLVFTGDFGLAIIAVFSAFIAGLFLATSGKPAIIIRQGVLETQAATNWNHRFTPIEKIRQLYISTQSFGDFGTTHYIYALLDNGNRIRVYGGFDDPEVAFYVEELLEVEMGLFNLPVFGDAPITATQDNNVALEADIVIPENCANCGAPLGVTAQQQQRGFITCNFCSTITLLYAKDADKPLLGLLSIDDPNLQFSITETDTSLTITDAKQELNIANGQLMGVSGNPEFFIKQVKQTGTEFELGEMFDRLKNIEQRMAYSDQVDFSGNDSEKKQQVMDWLFGDTEFQIVAKSNESESVILDGINDPREATMILMMIQQQIS